MLKKVLTITGVILGLVILIGGVFIFILFKQFKKPEILATDSIISFTDKGELFGKTRIVLRNDNSYSVKIDSLHYSMSVNGKEYMKGKKDSTILLAPHVATSVYLPYVFDSKAMEADFKDADSTMDDITVKGYVSVFGLRKIAFSFPLKKKTVLFKKPKLKGDQNYLRIGNDSIIRGNIVLDVENENKYEMRIDSFSYNLIIGDREYLHGQKIKAINLPAKGIQKINLPLVFDFKKYARNFRGTDSAKYKFQFEGLLSTPYLDKEHISIPLEKKLPVVIDFKVDVEKVKINRISLKDADLTASVKIGNPNASDFKADRLHWKFMVENKLWAEGDYNKLVTLKKKSSVKLDLPIHLDFKVLDNSAREYLKGDKVQNYKVEATFNLITDDPDMKKVKMDMSNGGVFHLGQLLKKKK